MPLYKEFSDKDFDIFIWKYDENEALDINQLMEPENLEKIKNYPKKKLLESLMIRAILHEKLPNHKILYQNRVPYLSPKDFEISISHSFPFAVLVFSKEKIGVDIEKISPRLSKIKDKFTQENEQKFIPENEDDEYFTTIWTIKESLYKLHHSKQWSLKKYYEVFPFSLEKTHKISCCVYHENTTEYYTASSFFVEDFVISIVR